ncbi:hypothetical protein L7F22_064561 [Adiantum nelumboides]|nr:hypothetical protein [Adiantum nelumboides]
MSLSGAGAASRCCKQVQTTAGAATGATSRCREQDIIRYFADFMVNNSLGLISNAHVVFADMSPQKACDSKCIQLAKLCSIAVDFPKTGIPAVLPTDLRPQKYPDFMEKSDKPSYKSEKVLGKLFQAVVKADKDEKVSSFTRQEAVML